jgi:hypothetical protein
VLQGGGAIVMRALASKASFWPDKQQWLIILLVIATLFFAALSGAVVALGSKILLFPIFFLIGAAIFAITPAHLSLWGLALVCLLVEGPVIYFLKFEFFRWFPPIFAIAMALPLLLHIMHRKPGVRTLQGYPPFTIWLILFLITLTFSTLISAPKFAELTTAWRDYLAFWPVMLLLFMGVLAEKQMLNMWRFILVVAVIQFPVSLYQHFIVAKQSAWGTSWDAVVGTFPGNAEGGGASAAMATFVLIAVIAAVALWQRGKMRTWLVATIGIVGVGTMLFAEVKAAVLMIPLGMAILYSREILRRPMQTLVMVVAGIVAMLAIFYAYNEMYYGYDQTKVTALHRPSSPVEAMMNQLDPERVNSMGNELSRAGLIDEWWTENVVSGDFTHSVFGYGIGATNISRLGLGEMVMQFRHYVDGISTSFLLWETGLLGHGLFVLMLVSAAHSAYRLCQTQNVPPEHQALLHAAAVAILILILTLPYKNFLFKTPPSQFLMVFILGYIGYWYRRVQVMQKDAGAAVEPSVGFMQYQNKSV